MTQLPEKPDYCQNPWKPSCKRTDIAVTWVINEKPCRLCYGCFDEVSDYSDEKIYPNRTDSIQPPKKLTYYQRNREAWNLSCKLRITMKEAREKLRLLSSTKMIEEVEN